MPSIVLSFESSEVNKRWSLLSRGIYNLQRFSKPLFENPFLQFTPSPIKMCVCVCVRVQACAHVW